MMPALIYTMMPALIYRMMAALAAFLRTIHNSRATHDAHAADTSKRR